MAAKSSEPRRTSVPSREIEMQSNGTGPVVTRQWTLEEEAYYKSLPGPGKTKKRIKTVSEQQQQRKPIPDQHQEAHDMKTKENPGNGLTREIFLEQLAAGETVGSIEKAWKMKYNTLPYWIKKWDLQGVKPELAAAMVEQAKEQASANVAAAQSGTETALLREKDVTPAEDQDAAAAEFRRLKEENADLTRRLEEASGRMAQYEAERRHTDPAAIQARVKELEEAMKGAAVVATQAGARIKELEDENGRLEVRMEDAEGQANRAWAAAEELQIQLTAVQMEYEREHQTVDTLQESIEGIRLQANEREHELEYQLHEFERSYEKSEQRWQQQYEAREIELRQAKDWVGGLDAQIIELESALAAEREEKALLLRTIEQAADTTRPTVGMSPGVVTLTYALLDFGGDRLAQRQKCVEEADEYCVEVEMANIDLSRAAAELYDAGQSFVGLIRKSFQELLVADPDVATQQYFEQHNQRHLAKMRAKALGL